MTTHAPHAPRYHRYRRYGNSVDGGFDVGSVAGGFAPAGGAPGGASSSGGMSYQSYIPGANAAAVDANAGESP